MTNPYICAGTIVRTKTDRRGKVIGVDKAINIAVIKSNTSTFTEKIENLIVVSYAEVD